MSVPAPGTIVWIRQQRWRVESARLDRSVVRLDVADRHRRLTFLTPFDRPAAIALPSRLRYARPRSALARLAGLVARTLSADGLPGALDADVAILPYQLEPALAAASGVRRMLVADDVGLGKTVQAGLVIAEVHRRLSSARTLVIVPAALRDQWLGELDRRFGIEAELADRDSLAAMAPDERAGTNPWRRAGVWVASADYLKQVHVFDAIPLQPWDLVVIDEAHDACGSSARHDAADELARRARQVLLLTATPHSGDAARFDRLERLGRLAGIDDPLVVFRRTRTALAMPSVRRVRWPRVVPTPAERRLLDALTAFERTVLAAATARRRDAAVLILSIFRKRALSSMTALGISVARRLSWVTGADTDLLDWIQPRLALEDEDDRRADDDASALTAEIDLDAGAERRWLRRLGTLAQTAIRTESKVAHVVRLLGRTTDPAVVFTEFRHTLEAIARRLAGARTMALLHGAQTAAERRAELDRFRRGAATVLVATDVASQGLNLHERARWVVSVELPWNPARLAQRIGRVDRIGQSRPVHASILVARHPAESALLARLAMRAVAVRRSTGADGLEATLPPGEQAVARALFSGEADPATSESRLPAPSSAAWRRRARAVARQLVARRALRQRWRARTVVAGRPSWTTTARLPAVRGLLGPHLLIVVSVPIVDGTGFVVERPLVCLVVPGAAREHAAAIVRSGAASERIAARLAPRVDRLRRLLAAAADRRLGVELAVAAHLHAVGWPEEAQPGLFDGREDRAFDASRWSADELADRSHARRHQLRAAAELDLGTPAIEAVFEGIGDT